jgi:hypothetical protein
VLNRIFNLTRRQEPQVFPPRKRTMAATWFGRSDPETPELTTFVVEEAEQGAALLAAPSGGPPSGAPARTTEPPGLALGQMRLAIERGLLMVFGPEGDPVPPHAFAAAAAAHPGTLLALPDGTTAPASRVAAVLGAQSLGRLGAADQAAGWILAMLRGGGRLEPASEDQLRAEQGAPGAPGSQPAVAADAGGIAAGAPPRGGGQTRSSGHDIPAGEAGAAPPTPRDEAPAAREALDQASLDQAAASIGLSPDLALPRLELDFEALALADAGLDLDVFADRLAADRPGCGPDDAPGPVGPGQADPEQAAEARQAAETRQADLDPDSMVLVVMRGVPEDARLSTGVRDDDGSWLISPLDLSTVTISLAPRGEGGGDAPGAAGDLSITGIAIAEDGELVAVSETVPLADYLGDLGVGDPGASEPAPVQDGEAGPAEDAASVAVPRMIALALNPPALAGEAFDALVIRDLPAGARLSAGAYDPAIDGWVLRPQDLGALAILPPPQLRADFTVTLLGIALRPGEANAARVLARLPVRLA